MVEKKTPDELLKQKQREEAEKELEEQQKRWAGIAGNNAETPKTPENKKKRKIFGAAKKPEEIEAEFRQRKGKKQGEGAEPSQMTQEDVQKDYLSEASGSPVFEDGTKVNLDVGSGLDSLPSTSSEKIADMWKEEQENFLKTGEISEELLAKISEAYADQNISPEDKNIYGKLSKKQREKIEELTSELIKKNLGFVYDLSKLKEENRKIILTQLENYWRGGDKEMAKKLADNPLAWYENEMQKAKDYLAEKPREQNIIDNQNSLIKETEVIIDDLRKNLSKIGEQTEEEKREAERLEKIAQRNDENARKEKVIELEKALDNARTKYAEEYKKFLASAGWFTRAYRFVAGAKIKDSDIPPELKNLENEYEKATVAYGQNMYEAKQAELENSLFIEEEKKAELARYKQNEIFTKVIVEEQIKLNNLKAENLQPKEKGMVGKSLDWYLKQPRWKKLAISSVLGTVMIATFSGGSVAAAGGLATFAGMRATRAVVGSMVAQGTAKAFDWIFKEKSAEKRATEEKELAEMFKEETFDISLAKSKKEYTDILKREQNAKRGRLITKALIGLAAGIGTSLEMGNLLHNVPDQLHTPGIKPVVPTETHTPPIPTHEVPSAPEAQSTPAEVKVVPAETQPVAGTGTTEAHPTTSASATIIQETHTTIHPASSDAIVHKGEGIEHALGRQIEHDPELAKKLGFDGDIKDAEALHKFSGGAAHRLAIEKGFVDNAGHEVRITEADKTAFEIKSVGEKVFVTEKSVEGKIFGSYDKGKYEFGENPLNPYDKEFATPTHGVAPGVIPGTDHVVRLTPGEFEDFERMAKTPIAGKEISTEKWTPTAEELENQKTVDVMHAKASALEKIHDGEFAKNPYHLTEDKLVQTYKAHQEIISRVFPKDTNDVWNFYKGAKVEDVLATDLNKAEKGLASFASYLHELKRASGISTHGGIFGLGHAKTVGEYEAQALEKLAKRGILETFQQNLEIK